MLYCTRVDESASASYLTSDLSPAGTVMHILCRVELIMGSHVMNANALFFWGRAEKVRMRST